MLSKLEKISLSEINNELVKLYINGEFNRRPLLPHLYLTTDEVWTNTLG